MAASGGAGGGGGSNSQNLVTGLIPGGASLEREIPQNFASMKEFRYQLLNPDFTTSVRMARRINEELGESMPLLSMQEPLMYCRPTITKQIRLSY